MKKLLILIMFVLLSGCANSIPKGFTQEALESKAQSVVSLLQEGNTETVLSLMRSDVAAMITADQLTQVIEAKYASVGAVKETKSFLISDTKDPSTQELYALVIVQVDHEKGRATYTLSFNTNYELVGLYLK